MRRLILALALSALCLTAQSKKKILVVNQSPDVVRDWQSASSQVEIVNVKPDQIMSQIGDADAFVGVIKPAEVQAGKKLKWVQVTSAGVETVLHRAGSTALRDSNIVVTNNQIVQGPEIADHAMGMLLYFTRMLHVYSADRLTESWRRGERFGGIELRGKTGIVIGLGGIGQQIAMRAWAHGMHVIGVDPEDMPYSPFWPEVVKPDQLDGVLPRADVVFISAPHTEKSHKMMGPNQFELMKQGSYFIAVSRGGLYDLDALVKALDSKRIAGAGVDVTDPEPLPKGHSLWKFSNAIITPHIAGRSDADNARMLGTVKENIRRFAEGKPLINVVDKQKGY